MEKRKVIVPCWMSPVEALQAGAPSGDFEFISGEGFSAVKAGDWYSSGPGTEPPVEMEVYRSSDMMDLDSVAKDFCAAFCLPYDRESDIERAKAAIRLSLEQTAASLGGSLMREA